MHHVPPYPQTGSRPPRRGTHPRNGVLAALLVLGSALPVAAQDAPPAFQATTDLGFVNAAGNTDVTTFNVGEEILLSSGPWGIKQTFGVVYGRTDGTVSTSLWRAGIRGDRSVGARLGIYLLGAFDRNTFAGITRRFEEGAGLVLKALETPTDRLEFEAGAGLTQQRSIARESTSFASARGAGTYRRSFSEASHVQLSSEVLPNLEESEDLRVNSTAELVAPLSARIAMKLSYVIRFDNLPEPGFEKTDRLFTAGLQISF
jgi:putative salt-induced outer membrane protein